MGRITRKHFGTTTATTTTTTRRNCLLCRALGLWNWRKRGTWVGGEETRGLSPRGNLHECPQSELHFCARGCAGRESVSFDFLLASLHKCPSSSLWSSIFPLSHFSFSRRLLAPSRSTSGAAPGITLKQGDYEALALGCA